MKIGIDIRPLSHFSADRSGLYQHVYNLVFSLLAVDGRNEYSLLSCLRGFPGDERIAGRLLRRFPGRLSAMLLERLSVPVEFLMGKLDLFHGPCFFTPRSLRSKSIVTIHDVMLFRHPEFASPEWVVSFKKNVLASARSADAIIAVSRFTKSQILELVHVPEERIRVIYNGISSAFRPIEDEAAIEAVKYKHGIKGRYLLFVGDIQPKKNVETLIQACVELRRSTNYCYPLVLVGNKGEHFEAAWELTKRLGAESDTIFTDTVEDEDLPGLYSGAEAFVFPSLYEGFGIPVVEAMACGTPVVASNRTSIPEIAGGAALLVNPLKVEEMAEAMRRVLSDFQLRDQLVEKGLERAKEFSWERTARETLEVYSEVGGT